MHDEFDDAVQAASPRPSAAVDGHTPDPVPRWIGEMYRASDAPLRARLLQRLLDPLGTLGVAAIAAGAFAGFLQRRSAEGFKVSLEEAGRFTSEQIAELVQFVAQVSPESLQAIAGAFADAPTGITALGASFAVLLMRRLRASETNASMRRGDADLP